MKSKIAAIVVILLLLCSLGVMGALLYSGEFEKEAEAESLTLPTAEVSRGSISDRISGTAEIKEGHTEKLKSAKWRYFSSFVAPLNKRIPAGTPLVEYTNGEALCAPYDLVIRSRVLPEKKYDALTDEHYVEVSRVDVMHVELSVHENDIAKLAEGQSAQVTLGSDSSKVYEGVITEINQVGTYNATGTKYKVTIEIINDGNLLISMSSDVDILVGEVVDVLTIPVSAINDTNEGAFVMVVNSDGSMDSVAVETGLSDGSMVEIIEGLSEGDQVVINEGSSTSSEEAGAGGISFAFAG